MYYHYICWALESQQLSPYKAVKLSSTALGHGSARNTEAAATQNKEE